MSLDKEVIEFLSREEGVDPFFDEKIAFKQALEHFENL
jgi:hypothetical protein